MTTATETMQKILDQGQQQADGSPKQVGELSPGDHVAQGDVLFWKLGNLPNSTEVIEEPEAQLAPGTTKGSRHCVRLDDMKNCVFHKLERPNALQGPIIESKGSFTVEHPEHGDITFPPGNWAVTYQRAFAEELKRILD